ncbi:MAG: primosomal protein N', partial [Gammaproteobacteria bacterium]
MTVILRVAVPTPLYQLFDYLPPAGDDGPFRPGMRVRVPFGRGKAVGVLLETTAQSEVPDGKLRRALERLDPVPLLDGGLLDLARWAAGYYHHPIGEVLATMLPVALRQGAAADLPKTEIWRVNTAGKAVNLNELKRAPRQAALLARLQQAPNGLPRVDLDGDRSALGPLRELAKKGWVERIETEVANHRFAPTGKEVANHRFAPTGKESAFVLNDDQAAAVAAIAGADGFAAWLLDGVTGSGKTEVYLQAIERVLAADKQALVLVPEISLTPQLVGRFHERFAGVPLAVMHSGLNDGERVAAWLRAARGLAPIVIGTRSAVFTPLARLGLIVVDEEHDTSFKQHEGFRYSARDLAVWRAHQANIPIVLGSATPSLESLLNARAERYRALHLPERAGVAAQPSLHLLDVRGAPLQDGLSGPLVDRMNAHLAAGSQVLLFLNRRGYAPVLHCSACGWKSGCPHCSAWRVFHKADRT